MRSERKAYNTRGSVPTVGTATSVANSSAGLSATANKPTVQDGTLLIAQLCANGTLTALSTPAGWTSLISGNTGTYVFQAFYKYIPVAANESATTYTWSWTTNSRSNSLIILPIYNPSQATSPFDTANPSSQTGATTSAVPSTVLVPPTNVLLVGGCSANTDAGSTITVPTQMTEATQVAGARNSIAYESRSSGGQVGGSTAQYSRTWTTSPSATVSAWMIAVRPTDTFTWSKPNWAQEVTFIIFDGGAGGGSGRKNATNLGRGGGGGGASGKRLEVSFPASVLPATATVTVGGGGSGGASQATASTDGRTGGSGGNSVVILGGSFSNLGFAALPTGGTAGTASLAGGGSVATDGWTVHEQGSAGATGNTTSGSAASATLGPGSGGGGGTGVTSGNSATGTGGSGGLVQPFLQSTNTNSGAEGAAGSTGTADPTGMWGGQGGAGGKGSTVGAGGRGGDGGAPGGGGGGGGGSTDSVGDSGAGGDGGCGAVIVVSVG